MTIKCITLFLLAFACTPNAHACSGPVPGWVIPIGGIIVASKWFALGGLNALFIGGKLLGLKRNLPHKNLVISTTVGTATSMVLTLASGIYFNDNEKLYKYSISRSYNNMPLAFFIASALTTGYNFYQCTKEEPKEPAKIILPVDINHQIIKEHCNKNQQHS